MFVCNPAMRPAQRCTALAASQHVEGVGQKRSFARRGELLRKFCDLRMTHTYNCEPQGERPIPRVMLGERIRFMLTQSIFQLTTKAKCARMGMFLEWESVTMLGPGRPAKRPSIEDVRELTREEVARTPRASVPMVKQLRDSHHMVARLFAMGLRAGQVAERTGYSLARVSTLSGDPAFKELVASYRDMVNEDFRAATDEYFESAIAVRVTSLRLIRDRLEEAEPGDIPLNQLVAIHADTADRTGYPKRKESVNLNIDFADRLEKARKRSSEAKVIDSTSQPTAPANPPRLPVPLAPADGAGPEGPARSDSDTPLARPLSVESRFPQLRRRA